MRIMHVASVGAVADGFYGPAAVARRFGEDAVPGGPAISLEALDAMAAAFRQRTQQRYIDKAVETGLKALNDAVEALSLDQPSLNGDPTRVGILIATNLGPAATRDQYLHSYVQRKGRSASATLFSNCGYNIVGAMLARSCNIRGPVLTFGAGGEPCAILDVARRLLNGNRADRLFVGRAETDNAIVVSFTRDKSPSALNARRLFIEAGVATPDSRRCRYLLSIEQDDSTGRSGSGRLGPTLAKEGERLSSADSDNDILWRIARLWWQTLFTAVPRTASAEQETAASIFAQVSGEARA